VTPALTFSTRAESYDVNQCSAVDSHGIILIDGSRSLETVQNTYSIHPSPQNHRMFGVGRDLGGSPSPTPLPKQGHLEQAAQDLVQAGPEYLQRWRLHNLSGQSVVLTHFSFDVSSTNT